MAKLFIVQGDTAQFQLNLTNPDCSPIDLTNYGITFTIKQTKTDTDADAIFQGTLLNGDIVIVGPPANGQIQVIIPHSSTVLMRQGKAYYWDCQLEDSANKISTPLFGLIFAMAEVTQSV